MKILKRIGLILSILLIVLIAAAFAIPYFFKDQIVLAVKEKVNQTVNAKVDFEDVSLSLFRSFPDLSFQLKNYSVVGKSEFEGITLANGESFGVDLDLMSVIRNENIEVNAIDLIKPYINIMVLRDGKANYDITRPAPKTDNATSADFMVKLNSYRIKDGHIIYEDRSMPVFVELKDLNHKGSGNFTSEIFDLATTTDVAQFTAKYDGTTYLIEATTDLEATFNIDTKSSKYTLKDNELKVNDMIIKADGYVQMAGDDINMDLTFNAPQNEFKNLFSLIPYAYIKDYDDVKINGGFTLDGNAQGTFNSEKEQYPSFKLNLGVSNGDVKYPDLPLGIKDINANVLVYSPTENLNDMSVDVSRFNVQIGNHPFGGTFKLRTPLTDPDIDTKIKGKINLADLAKAFPIEGVETLSGIIDADVAAKTKMSTIDKGDYANVNMSGKANIQDMVYDAIDMPPVKISKLQSSFNPQNVSIDKLEGKLGKSDIYATGTIDNILAYFSPKNTMKGQFTVRSNYFDADEWMATSESTATTTPLSSTTATPPPSDNAVPFDNFNFDINASMGKLVYDIYNISNMDAEANISSNRLSIKDFKTNINGSDIKANGVIDNVLNFVYYNEGIKGNINFASDYMNLDKLMEGENPPSNTSNASTSATASSEVPDIKFDLDMKGSIKKMDYDVYQLSNFKGDVNITEKQIVANSFNTKIGKSDISGSGIIQDYMEYVFKNETVSGNLNINSNFMDLNELMAEDPEAATSTANTTENLEPYLVPENMAFDIVAKIDKALYTNMELRNINCKMKVTESKAAIEELTTNTLGGTMAMKGAYDTKDKENPKFDLKYDLANLDFQKSFNTLNTFQAAAPIGKYLNGNFNTTLVMDGLLGKNMMPKLNSLSADGFLETIKGVINNAPALNAIGDKLGIAYFSEMEFLNTKNWFTIKDGKVEVKEFDYKYKDIDMKIGGWHGLEQDMNYNIKARIPRELLKGSVGKLANKGLDFLGGQASKLGINLAQGEYINVMINLTGSHNKPKVDIKLLGTEGERTVQEEATAVATEKVNEVKEEAKQQAEEKLSSAKEQAKKEADKVVDTLSTVAQQKADEIIEQGKEKVEEAVKDEIGKKVGEEATEKAKEKVGEVLGEDSKEEVDKIKDKLDTWNPFGKKKDKKDKNKKGN